MLLYSSYLGGFLILHIFTHTKVNKLSKTPRLLNFKRHRTNLSKNLLEFLKLLFIQTLDDVLNLLGQLGVLQLLDQRGLVLLAKAHLVHSCWRDGGLYKEYK